MKNTKGLTVKYLYLHEERGTLYLIPLVTLTYSLQFDKYFAMELYTCIKILFLDAINIHWTDDARTLLNWSHEYDDVIVMINYRLFTPSFCQDHFNATL